MVHPYLFLEFFRELLRPLFFPKAVTSEAITTANAAVDTIVYTWLVILLLLLFSMLSARSIKTVPQGMQNFAEAIIANIEKMITETMGEHGRPFFPLIATLALFILTSNLIGLIPGFFPPTANINTTAACAVIVFLSTHVVGIKEHGLHYVKHFLGPIWWLAPMIFFIEIIGHISRPVSLTLRLFGNMNGHELILMVFFALVPYFVPLPMMLMGVLVSFIQAFVFMLLSMIYIQGSLEEAH